MNNISSRRSRAQLDAEMPLRQYFLFVGGALLALLFVANWLVPASRERADSAVNFPPIRIHSDWKGPEAVVIDTSKSMLAPMLAVHEDVVAPQAVSSEEAAIDNASAPSETRMSQQTEASELTQTREDRTSRGSTQGAEDGVSSFTPVAPRAGLHNPCRFSSCLHRHVRPARPRFA